MKHFFLIILISVFLTIVPTGCTTTPQITTIPENETHEYINPEQRTAIFRVIRRYNSRDLFITPNIPHKMLTNSQQVCVTSPEEEILALIDSTIFEDAKNSLLIGNSGIYMNNPWQGNSPGRHFIPYDEFIDMPVRQDGWFGVSVGGISFSTSACVMPGNKIIELLQDIQQAIQKEPSIVASKPTTLRGSGFIFASSGFVATNYHVVSDHKNIQVYLPKHDREFTATVEMKDTNNDLAILKIKDFTYDDIFSQEIPFGLKKSSGVQLGEKVFTLGFPLSDILGKSAKFSDGTISSLTGLRESATLFQINNPIQPGNSGGPLFDQDGNLVGIVVSSLKAKYFYEKLDTVPQNVNFAIKAEYLINLISMLPDSVSIQSRKGSLKNKSQEEQVSNLLPYIVTVRAK